LEFKNSERRAQNQWEWKRKKVGKKDELEERLQVVEESVSL